MIPLSNESLDSKVVKIMQINVELWKFLYERYEGIMIQRFSVNIKPQNLIARSMDLLRMKIILIEKERFRKDCKIVSPKHIILRPKSTWNDLIEEIMNGHIIMHSIHPGKNREVESVRLWRIEGLQNFVSFERHIINEISK